MTLPSYVASSNVDMGAGGNGTSVVLTRPAAWVSGDTAYVGIYKESSAAITPPSGWTELSGSPFANSTNFWSHVFRKVLGGSEPSTYTWSWTGSIWREAGGLSIHDTDQTTPENQGPSATVTTSTTTTITCPALTPSVANTLILCIGFNFADASYTSNDGMTERIDFGVRAFTFATETGPSSGVSTGTNTFTSTSGAPNTGISLLLQEVQGGGGGFTAKQRRSFGQLGVRVGSRRSR